MTAVSNDHTGNVASVATSSSNSTNFIIVPVSRYVLYYASMSIISLNCKSRHQ